MKSEEGGKDGKNVLKLPGEVMESKNANIPIEFPSVWQAKGPNIQDVIFLCFSHS